MNHTNVMLGRANQHRGRSPDGAQRNPGPPRVLARIPDYAALHPGYEILSCLTSKTRKAVGVGHTGAKGCCRAGNREFGDEWLFGVSIFGAR